MMDTQIRATVGCLKGFLVAALVLASSARAQDPVSAQIEILGVSPRDVALTGGIFDEVATGLNVVGVGTKVYLQALPEDDATISGYQWAITIAPDGNTATLSAANGELVTFRPDAKGVYQVTLTPLDTAMEPGDVAAQTIYVANYVGAGVFNTHETPQPSIPNCATSFCHGDSAGNPRLRVLEEWIQSRHAMKLQRHLSCGSGSGGFYAESCNACHTTGFNENPDAVNGGFDDVAGQIGFDLAQIPGLVAESCEMEIDNFPALPAELQNLASIQCESCHGPGELHPMSLGVVDKGIAGANLGIKQCAQCHDSASGHQQKFYQWNTSAHPITASLSEGRVSEIGSCLMCHTGEGFVDVRVNGLEPTVITDPNPDHLRDVSRPAFQREPPSTASCG